ncbi:GNAT family N-acetyltransferase [Streptomyces sp. NPDC051214]|uniref:GNAT family N-acetyltransferase n=1 Tax=Streptomyces sp. NPDC051214 TaxID=3155282 RepID=UPI0034298699
MPVTIRTLAEPDELILFDHARALAFGHPLRRSVKPGATMELDRMHVAYEGGQAVGTAAAASFDLSLPGGSQTPCGGIRWVSTLPTHRRRGVLSTMVSHQLEEFHERGETVAVLWASQAAVYSRYGFGLATTSVDSTLIPRAPFLPGIVHDSVHYVHAMADDGLATKTLAPLYAQMRTRRPGLVSRNTGWWHHLTSDPATQWVVHEGPEGIDGYLGYQTEAEGWSDSGPSHRLHVVELLATTARAEASLWRFALDFDLTSTVIAKRRPTDDALPWMLADIRQAQRTVRDGLWLRIVDLAAALTARSRQFPPDTELRIRVTDELCPWNAGTWSLGPGSCARATGRPDLTVDTADLAACYLGADRWSALAQAGRVTEHTAGALGRLAAALGSSRAPWAITWF